MTVNFRIGDMVVTSGSAEGGVQPSDIYDRTGGSGSAGQYLSQDASGLIWKSLAATDPNFTVSGSITINGTSAVGYTLQTNQGKWIGRNVLGDVVLEFEPEVCGFYIKSGSMLEPMGFQSSIEAGQIVVTEAADTDFIQITGQTSVSTSNITFTDGDGLHAAAIYAQDITFSPAPLSFNVSDLVINGETGASGTYTTSDGKTVTVTNGLITSIV